MRIGSTDLTKTGFQKTTYFDVEQGKPNLYRVFPPLFSLADSGSMTFFHKTHSVWVTNKNGKSYPHTFKCIMKKKDKVVVQNCPLCDLAAKNKATYEAGKKMLESVPDGEMKELQKKQLNDFLKYKVWSCQADSKNYLNVMSGDGKIGVLRLPYKHYEALKVRLTDLQSNWKIDATGMNGIFLNFGKSSPYKGSIEVTFTVDAYMEKMTDANGMPQMTFKFHQITQDLINKMEKECQDLSLLYQEATFDVIKDIADNFENKEAVKAICERAFGKKEAQSTAPSIIDQVQAQVQPAAPAMVPNLTTGTQPLPQNFVPEAMPVQNVLVQTPVVQNVVTPPPAQPLVTPPGMFGTGQAQVPQGGLSNVSDDEFAKLFG